MITVVVHGENFSLYLDLRGRDRRLWRVNLYPHPVTDENDRTLALVKIDPPIDRQDLLNKLRPVLVDHCGKEANDLFDTVVEELSALQRSVHSNVSDLLSTKSAAAH